MFDCIIPTKMAQQGYAYTFEGLLRITRMAHRLEELAAGCDLRLLHLSALQPRLPAPPDAGQARAGQRGCSPSTTSGTTRC